MLTDAQLTLITAGVDGELSPADARRLDALVAANPLAAAAADQLRGTADRLRGLRKRRAPALLLPQVLARLPHAGPARRRARRPDWLPYAVAASLLLAVGGGSFWFFSNKLGHDGTARVRHALPVAAVTLTALPPESRREPVEGTAVAAGPDVLPHPREVFVAAAPQPHPTAPMPRSHAGDLVGAGISERAKPLQVVELKLPFTGTASEFAKEDVRARFVTSFAGEPAVRIDLFARNVPAAVDLLVAAVRAKGVALVVDAASKDVLKTTPTHPQMMLVEGLTPDELAKLLETLGKPGPGSVQPPVTSVHAFPPGPTEQKEWKTLFGADLGFFRSGRTNSPVPPSPSRPISDATIGKVKSVVGKNAEKSALLLHYVWGGQSAETKAYLDGRGDRKAGTLPAFLVVRPAAN